MLSSHLFLSALSSWHVKDPTHSAKGAGVRLHLNTHTSLTLQNLSGLTMLSRYSVGNYQGKELKHNLSWNTWPQLSQLTEPLWTNPGEKSGISVHKLSPKKKKCRQGMNGRTFPQKPPSEERATTSFIRGPLQYECVTVCTWAISLYSIKGIKDHCPHLPTRT